MPGKFFTIGHSNRDFEAFAGMLREAGIGLVADVRSFPRSRSNPQFNIDCLPDRLSELHIGYLHFPELGGRRKAQAEVPAAVNGFWRNQSFHNYADYALSPPFHAALNALIEQGKERRAAIMCAEAPWWRCHRRIITDYLLLKGYPVDHLMGPGKSQAATATAAARPARDARVVYPDTGMGSGDDERRGDRGTGRRQQDSGP